MLNQGLEQGNGLFRPQLNHQYMKNNLSSVSSVRSALRVCLSLVAVCVVATALSTFAQSPIGPNLPYGIFTQNSSPVLDPFNNSEVAWVFGSENFPYSFHYDPQAGVWEKSMTGVGSLDQFQEVNLVEYIKVGADPVWSDWHETLITPNFVWGSDVGDTFYTINGGASQNTGITFSGNVLNIVFPSAEPAGTVIMIQKEMTYTGLDNFDNNQNPIVLDQYATVPEPSSLAMLGLGAVLAFISRRRK